MLSRWVVDVLQRLTHRFQPRVRLHPARFVADLLFAISVFFWLNRRPVFTYRVSFWGQLLYLVQLFKVFYTLRFVLVELVFRELRTFFCFIHPVVKQLAIAKQWQNADPCVLKVVNLAFFLLFLVLNLCLAFLVEWMAGQLWALVKGARGWRRGLFLLPRPLIPYSRRPRRRRRRGSRYRVRKRPRSSFDTKPLFSSSFWSNGWRKGPAAALSGGTASSSSSTSVLHPPPVYVRTTRSGRHY